MIIFLLLFIIPILILYLLRKNKKKRKKTNLKLYILINTSLKMSKGKIISQISHLFSNFYSKKNNLKKDWKNQGEAKIILKANEDQIIKFYNLFNNCERIVIRDAGKTQIPAGSLTVMSVGPVDEIFGEKMKELKLY